VCIFNSCGDDDDVKGRKREKRLGERLRERTELLLLLFSV
jgi:hypothetical protein